MASAVLNTQGSVDRYVGEINRYALLSREQEVVLATRYRDSGDLKAAHQLVTANLRFVVKIAHEFSGYGLPLLDVIQEGNIGLMMAVKKFDPGRGYRFISYAVWWVRAYIQNYVIRSWSLVKVGTTQAQRKLFFRVRSEREKADRDAGVGELASTRDLAKRLNVVEGEVIAMEMRMAMRDFSLDAEIGPDSAQTHLERLPDARTASPEQVLGDLQQRRLVRGKVQAVLETLGDRERFIVEQRLMADEPQTLQEIGGHFRISRERARQLEAVVIRKLRSALERGGLDQQAA